MKPFSISVNPHDTREGVSEMLCLRGEQPQIRYEGSVNWSSGLDIADKDADGNPLQKGLFLGRAVAGGFYDFEYINTDASECCVWSLNWPQPPVGGYAAIITTDFYRMGSMGCLWLAARQGQTGPVLTAGPMEGKPWLEVQQGEVRIDATLRINGEPLEDLIRRKVKEAGGGDGK